MSTHKNMDKICCVAIVITLILAVIFMHGESLGIQIASKAKGYESRLFDTKMVHTIDIVIDDWEGFLETCSSEEYSVCSVVIDNESYNNVAIRAKGNTSLMQVASYGNDRYSFKIEFDHYDDTINYHGLDKLSLNNIIQDNTYMKDYLTYQMMGYFGVDAPLCSYVYITVNGQDWGLYLAVEGVEESFLERNYGSNYGELYKPDSQSMGGGRGNGGDFDMDKWQEQTTSQEQTSNDDPAQSPPENHRPENMPGQFQPPGNGAGGGGGIGFTMGSSDVSLIYSDDAYSSYQNIFDNAKTDITDTDKDRLIASLKQLNAYENIEQVVNVDAVIRYFVVHNFVCNFDSYTGSMIHNYYLYEENGQLSMIPWDYNLAFGGFQSAQDATSLVNYPIDTPVSGGTVDSRPMLAWIFSNDEYTDLYHQYFSAFVSEYFENGYFTEMIDSIREMISPYVEKDPTKFCTYEEFETAITTLKEFCLLRAQSIRQQLDGTIPATSEGQTSDETSLVDASSLNISDMGGMNTHMGGDMNRKEPIRDFTPTDKPISQPPDQEQNSDSQNSGQGQTENPPSISAAEAYADSAEQQKQNESQRQPSEVPNNGNPQSMPPTEGENGAQALPEFPGVGGQQSNQMPANPMGADTARVPGGSRQVNSQMTQPIGTNMWVLLVFSVCVLLAGIFVAVWYKKRG